MCLWKMQVTETRMRIFQSNGLNWMERTCWLQCKRRRLSKCWWIVFQHKFFRFVQLSLSSGQENERKQRPCSFNDIKSVPKSRQCNIRCQIEPPESFHSLSTFCLGMDFEFLARTIYIPFRVSHTIYCAQSKYVKRSIILNTLLHILQYVYSFTLFPFLSLLSEMYWHLFFDTSYLRGACLFYTLYRLP